MIDLLKRQMEREITIICYEEARRREDSAMMREIEEEAFADPWLLWMLAEDNEEKQAA